MSGVTTTEPSVESAVEAAKELRAMIPHVRFFIGDRITWVQGCGFYSRSVVIEIERSDNAFFAPTLSEAMSQVRTWHKEQTDAKA